MKLQFVAAEALDLGLWDEAPRPEIPVLQIRRPEGRRSRGKMRGAGTLWRLKAHRGFVRDAGIHPAETVREAEPQPVSNSIEPLRP